MIVAARKILREQRDLGVLGRFQPRKLRAILEIETRFRRDLLHLGLEHIFRVVDHFTREGLRLVRRDHAEFELEHRDVRHNVERRAAVQIAGVSG